MTVNGLRFDGNKMSKTAQNRMSVTETGAVNMSCLHSGFIFRVGASIHSGYINSQIQQLAN